MYGMTPIVRNAATLAHNIIYKYKDQLQAGILIAGIDDVDGPSIYEITLGGSMLKALHISTASWTATTDRI